MEGRRLLSALRRSDAPTLDIGLMPF